MKIYWNKIEFKYKGDQLTYVFIWARKKISQRYFSKSFNFYFPSLKAFNEYWKEEQDFFEANFGWQEEQ